MRFVIIVAGGSGKRLGGEIPKQFQIIQNKPILMHTINTFFNYSNTIKIIVVLPANQINLWNELCLKNNFSVSHSVVNGGSERFFSVKNGLQTITSENGVVAIHDGVRPLVNSQTIKNCFEQAQKHGNAIPVCSLSESIRQINHNTNVAIDRNTIKAVQTPQVFDLAILRKAYNQEYNHLFTDDASVVENIGVAIHLVDGNRENIKITEKTDLIIAEALLKQKNHHDSLKNAN